MIEVWAQIFANWDLISWKNVLFQISAYEAKKFLKISVS
jgi:hypothetical protein